MTDNFCGYPFFHLSVGQSSELKACCVAKHFDLKIADVTDLNQWWQSDPAYNQLRQDHINNVQNSICKTCWQQEAKGFTSMRNRINEQLPKQLDIKNPIVKNIEITGGRLCNLACKMCSRASSNQIERENRPWEKNWPALKELNWLDDPKEQEKLLKLLCLPSLTSIYFTGGEPQLMTCYQDLLEKLATKKDLATMTVHFNTNATVFNKMFWDLIKQFNLRQIDLSIDAVGTAYESIRYGSTWPKVLKNILDINEYLPAENKITIICLTTVLQLSNVDQAVALEEFFTKIKTQQYVEYKFTLLPVTNFAEWELVSIPKEILQNEYDKIKNLSGVVIDEFKKYISVAIENNQFTKDYAAMALEKELYFKKQFGVDLWDRRPDWKEIYQKFN